MTGRARAAMAPLFVPCPDAPRAQEQFQAVEERLRPFFDADVLGPLEVHVVARLGRLLGECDPDALLALAFAVGAPRRGHVCVDLSTLNDKLLPAPEEAEGSGEAAPERPVLRWPEDKEKLRAALDDCTKLVRGRDEEERVTPFVLDGDQLYMDRYWRYQGKLARALRDRAEAPMFTPENPALLQAGLKSLLRPLDDEGKPLPEDPTALDRQRLAAAVAALRRLTVLSGGPGMGKTYTIRVVLVLLYVQWKARALKVPGLPPLDVALAAPTGKAANRMKESLGEGLEEFIKGLEPALGALADPEDLRLFLTGMSTFTLHRLLGWQSRSPTSFRHNADNPLPQQVVVVDEASMVDLALMAKLVDAVGPDARLLLIGDRHQLASVEAGTVLADICGDTGPESLSLSRPFAGELKKQCGLDVEQAGAELNEERGTGDCIVQLNKYHRFKGDSGIGAFAKACLADKPEEATAVLLDSAGYPDVSLTEHGERGLLTDPVQEAILAGYRPYLKLLADGPKKDEPEQAFHRRVLEALDSFRVLCVHRKGRLGVTGLNKAIEELLLKDKKVKSFKPRSGNYHGQPIIVHRNDYAVGRFNGDVGLVLRRKQGVTDERRRRRLWVAFPGPGKTVEYLSPSRLPEHQTVFAMTIHKSQGSQFNHAMVVLPTQQSPILTRELIYTGVTRAARKMTMIGDKDLLVEALKKQVTRASGLGQELWQRE